MILFLMLLAALNFFNLFYILVFAAAVLFMLTPNRKLRLNFSTLALLILGMALVLFNPDNQDYILDMIKPFTYLLCFLLGAGLFINKSSTPLDLPQAEKQFSTVVYVMAGGTFLHFLLNMITNWSTEKRELLSDYWTKNVMSATAQAALAMLMIAVACAFLFSKSGKFKKLIAIGTLVLIVSYNLVLAGRTLFMILLIAFAVAPLYIRLTEKRKMLKTVLISAFVVLLLVSLYNWDVFGIKTELESSNFYMRFYGNQVTQGLDEDARITHKLAYLKEFVRYPWGGGNIRKIYGHSAHDLYLDTYDESGIFALVAVVVYIIASLGRFIRCIRSKKISTQTRLLVLCTYLICNIEFWMEPIMRGIPWLFAAYCFIDGALAYLLVQERAAWYRNYPGDVLGASYADSKH